MELLRLQFATLSQLANIAFGALHEGRTVEEITMRPHTIRCSIRASVMPGRVRGALHEEPSAVVPRARVREGRGQRCYGNPHSGTKPETVDTCQGEAYGRACPLLLGADDVATTKRAVAAQNGPVVLVGHSYGGAVITEAGTDPKVAGLVYVAAFAPDKGESVSTLIKDPVPGAPVPPIMPPQDGYLLLDKAKFPASFAGDVSAEKAAFMADSQVPWGVAALSGAISEPAWKTKPNWYLITTEDKMIPPAAQRLMSKRAGSTVVEVKGSHSIFLSQPQAVASLIEKAAKGVELVTAR